MRANTIFMTSIAALALIAVPAAAQNSSLDNLTASQTFPAWQNTVKFSVPTSGPNAGKPTGFGNYAKVTASIRYDAATQSYVIRDTGSIAATSSFGPGNKVGAESNATFTVYRKNNAGTTETLRLLNPGAANPLISLTYASYGEWRRTTPGATATAVNETYFVYGIKTTGAQMPRTGGAHYNTVLDGTYASKTAVYALSGTGSIDADFALGKITYSATPIGTPTVGAPLVFGTVGGSGSISFSSASFNGSANSANPNYKMSLSGYFFGPTANEVGAVFRLNATNGSGNGNGAMVGEQ